MRRIALVLLALAPLGCTSGGPGQLSSGSRGPALYGAEGLDEQPRLLTCAVPPRQAASRVYLVVPVRMTVRADGTVEPGSAMPESRPTISGSTNSEDRAAAQEMLRARGEQARDWAKRNAETCTFEPAQAGGKAVAAPVRESFMFTR